MKSFQPVSSALLFKYGIYFICFAHMHFCSNLKWLQIDVQALLLILFIWNCKSSRDFWLTWHLSIRSLDLRLENCGQVAVWTNVIPSHIIWPVQWARHAQTPISSLKWVLRTRTFNICLYQVNSRAGTSDKIHYITTHLNALYIF